MKSPAFQLYVESFLLGTSAFSAEEVGGYMRLLLHQWDKGGLPDDDKKLVQLSGVSKKVLQVIKEKFKKGEDGLLRNLRLEKERKKQLDWKEKSAKAGRKSGEIRKLNQHRTKKKPTLKNGSNQTATKHELSISDSIYVSKDVDTTDPFFEMFRRVAGKHISDSALMDEIAKFRNKYPNAHPNQSGALINAWVGNIGKEKPIVRDNNSFV